ncbi:hypothetical protein B0T26DRAFT_739750 [Lasiosphaeria miniovina]|uniref:Uncharacterized protein n=1 Tax=Lasiosphaeria miniovina TaxID=1954250 RepID=A0AA40DZQ0_9PEZI|nr:uncharacterized protein B0T26DRAFT_739750 [Lasiosphaeria miniovina]KAK0722539.1 hypothetical protein B0T26DRAFT_739750 [Lasiosphaeria miniovina]
MARATHQRPRHQRSPIPPAQRHFLPPELMAVIIPSVQAGAWTGAMGMFAGTAFGIARGAPPLIYSLAMGGQWFTLGSSYYGARLVALRALRGHEEPRSADKTKASAIAGGFAGAVSGMIRGPRNILPGAAVFMLLGAGGQAVVNSVDSKPVDPNAPKKGFLDSKWSPVTRLTDRDYEKMLEEKLLRVKAEIAIVDDSIKALHEEEQKGVRESSLKQPDES